MRLPRPISGVRASPAPEMKTRGPTVKETPTRSGSDSTTPAMRKSRPPMRRSSPSRRCSRASRSEATTVVSGASSAASGRAGFSTSVP